MKIEIKKETRLHYKPIETRVNIKQYIADDGTVFTVEKECVSYEKKVNDKKDFVEKYNVRELVDDSIFKILEFYSDGLLKTYIINIPLEKDDVFKKSFKLFFNATIKEFNLTYTMVGEYFLISNYDEYSCNGQDTYNYWCITKEEILNKIETIKQNILTI